MICSQGVSYGCLDLSKSSIVMTSNDAEILNLKLEQVSQCVVPGTNRDEVEIHFHEDDKIGNDEDLLVQATFHFPKNPEADDDEDDNTESKAEDFKKRVFETGIIRSVTGNVIVEFTKDQGNFLTPRGKYSVQMLATAFQMQGAQYAYKIKYEDIQSLFLLPKPDGGRMAFVISLEKPIRQGNQKYQHLIIETHKVENTITVNLSDEEIAEKYAGQLTKEMTAPLSTLFAKIFKVLSQTTVYVPKHFVSSRETNAVRCSLKANEGLLYPLAKSFIFIHKPTVILKFDDVESIEFQRYDPTSTTGARNFDLLVTLKSGASSDAREYNFASIDKAEYSALYDFFVARNLNIIKNESTKPTMDLGEDEDEDESEDDDYVGGSSSSSDGSDDEDDDGGSDNGEGGGGKPDKTTKKRKKESDE